jgi:hypothetical protein
MVKSISSIKQADVNRYIQQIDPTVQINGLNLPQLRLILDGLLFRANFKPPKTEEHLKEWIEARTDRQNERQVPDAQVQIEGISPDDQLINNVNHQQIDELAAKVEDSGKKLRAVQIPSSSSDPVALLLRRPQDIEAYQRCLAAYRAEPRVQTRYTFQNMEPPKDAGDGSIIRTYYDNHLGSLRDIDIMINKVVQDEQGKGSGRFKIHCDFGIIKEVTTYDDDNDGLAVYTYEYLLPLQRNIQKLAPLIITDDDSKNKYIEYLKDELLGYQNFNQESTK